MAGAPDLGREGEEKGLENDYKILKLNRRKSETQYTALGHRRTEWYAQELQNPPHVRERERETNNTR